MATESVQTATGASSSLLRFPTKLVHVLLVSTPDALTLRALVFSNSVFYRAFISAEKAVLKAVLENEFRPDVLTDALAAHLSTTKFRGELEHVFQPSVPPTVPVSWSLMDSVALSRLCTDVQYLARDYSCSILEQLGHRQISLLLSQREIDRVERSFYRFEACSNLLSKMPEDISPNSETALSSRYNKMHTDWFLFNSAPWENEQIASIYEYLLAKLSEAFNDVAQHDILMGHYWVPWCLDGSPPLNKYKEYYMSQGLAFLRRIADANTYEGRYELLSPFLHSRENFLSEVLFGDTDTRYGGPLRDLSAEQIDQVFPNQRRADEDGGPKQAWLWAYQDQDIKYINISVGVRHLRRQGYVFLDADRVQEFFIKRISHEPPILVQWRDEISKQNKKDFGMMTTSWKKRSELWQQGWRGWWSEGDQSKLTRCNDSPD